MEQYNKFEKGSEWRKWDLHIHAPSKYTCAKHDRFQGEDLEDKQNNFIEELKTVEDISVLGVTDYFSLDGYKFVMSKKDELTNFDLILPNIELRISPVTGANRKINLHIIPNTELLTIEEIETFLYKFEFSSDKFNCKESNLIALGKKKDEGFSDEKAFKEGLNDFHISYDKFFEVFNASSEKFRKNVLIGVSNNSSDGASGIKDIQGIRDIIYSGVNFIFSAQSSDRNYFTGQSVDSREQIISKYKSLKPCVHGSDYHGGKDGKRICVPDLNRFCWIKSDPTFEGFKQVIYEPTDRVSIEENKPDDKLIYQIIEKVKFQDTNFTTRSIELNSNLISIIGGKSTGKSILLKNIAKTVDELEYNNRIEAANIPNSKALKGMEVTWKDGQISSLGGKSNPNKKIIYIPQSYLNRVIDDDMVKTDIDDIIKDVLLQDEHFELWYQSLTLKEKNIDDSIDDNIKKLFDLMIVFIEKSKELKQIGDEKGIEEQIKRINFVISNDENKLDLTEEEKNKYKEKFELIKSKSFEIEKIESDIKTLNLIQNIKVGLYLDSDFSFSIQGNSDEINKLKKQKENSYSEDWKKETQKIIDSNLTSLLTLKQEREIELKSIKHLQEKIDKLKNLTANYKKLEEEEKKSKLIKGIKGKKENAKTEIDKTIAKLSSLMSSYYSIYLEAKDNVDLKNFDDELKFSIETIFQKKDYQDNFINNFFDGRSIYKKDFEFLTKLSFKSKEDFKSIIQKCIKSIINNYFPNKEGFYSKAILTGFLKNWFVHNYKVEYQGDKINEMSPGKKSFVLLRLLIDLDNSKCPILIDQPEDDLDNRSIYSEVVKFLRKKKTQRQIIIATHNPNLVLGADAEQVIVANQEGKGNVNKSGFKFDYVSGSIEHTMKPDSKIKETLLKRGIQEHICEILEGGKEAFEKRKNKYNF